MIGIFKQKNPGNALLLLLYAMVLKFPMFLHPVKPVVQDGDNYIYKIVLRFLESITGNASIIFSVIAFLLLFTQATLLNRIASNIKLLPRPNFLVGMAYLLATTLMKDWSQFSAPLLVNSLLIIAWYKMIGLYNNPKPKTSIFNVAVLTGVLPLIYSPAVAFILLLLVALLLTRPLRITEWLIGLLGIITPYYFLFVILYLTSQWDVNQIIPVVTFHLPKLPGSLWITGGIILLVLPFLLGGYFVQANLNKMLIHVRKAWSLLLLFLMVSLLIILFNPGTTYLHWMLIVVPITAFHAATYFYINARWFALLLHWVIFAFAVLLNYAVFP